MKNLFLASVLMMFGAVSQANAADVTGTVGATTDYMYHGVSVSGNDPTVFGNVRFDNTFVDGLGVSVSGVVVDSSPFNSSKTVRSEFGVFYDYRFTDNVSAEFGAYRVLNPIVYANDYNELRASVDWSLNDKLSVFGQASTMVSSAAPRDTYLAVGARYKGLFTNKLTVSALVSTVHQDYNSEFTFNNLELGAEYALTNRWTVFGTYSVGGDTVLNGVNGLVHFNATNIPSGGALGVKYTF